MSIYEQKSEDVSVGMVALTDVQKSPYTYKQITRNESGSGNIKHNSNVAPEIIVYCPNSY